MSEIKISTKTIIGVSNIECNIENIYKHLRVLEMEKEDELKIMSMIPFKKQRGRRKKETDVIIEERKKIMELLIQPKKGDIVGLYYQNNQRGLPQYLKHNNKRYFRNALNIIMMLSPTKKVNFKLSKNGKIQMTGCKHDDDAQECISLFFEKLYHECFEDIVFDGGDIKIYYYTVMTNIDFNMGFRINRQKLNEMINKSTEFNSLLETSFGYTGVNIKIPMTLDEDILIDELNFSIQSQTWINTQISYHEFLNHMNETFRKQESMKKRYNTFLVFHSGNVIMSGMRLDKMIDLQKSFYKLLSDHRSEIEELLC